MNAADWPAIDYREWRETCAALHLWTQIVGKYRLANTPWVNHSWHATLYVTPRGLTTGPVPDRGGTTRLSFDFCDHRLLGESERCGSGSFPLEPMSVSGFLHRTIELIEALGGNTAIHGSPNEIAAAVPFAEDTQHRPYDRGAVERFHRALLRVESVFQQFRTGFLGKVSPVHLFWGALDLAVTRFSGRPAPRHPGGIPNLPDAVTREAYSHEVSSAGFWPGGGGVDEAMFYSYAYPEPPGFAQQPILPDGAGYHAGLREYLLPYEQVRSAADPEGTLLQFLQSAYLAAADCGGWDRALLECDPGRVRVPRAVL
ncbi:MAG TPA: DUF5996 family protein [Pseudomonadales bacterium]